MVMSSSVTQRWGSLFSVWARIMAIFHILRIRVLGDEKVRDPFGPMWLGGMQAECGT